jgi:hypothetical protein
MPDFTLDWSTVMKSPLVLFLPTLLVVAGLTWALTEALSFRVPSKYRPSTALMLGPALGWSVNRLELLDFGWGPNGWGRALFFGLFAGVVAVLAHDKIKDRWPFSILTTRTPGATPAAPPVP